MATPTTRRRRSSSLLQYVATAHDQRDHHLSHLERLEPAPPPTHPSALTSASSSSSNARPRLPRRPTDPIIQSSKAAAAPVPVQEYGHPALRFIARPHDTFLVLAAVFSLWAAWRTFLPREYRSSNPFSAFLVVQHQVDWRGEQRFRKGWKDALFLVYWVVVFSFLRETVMRGPARALGKRWGIRLGCRKMERFMEQGYAVFYFGLSSAVGLWVMSQQDTWFYRTEHMWLDYPNHWAMTRAVKTYYLTSFAYWLQQSLVMLAGLEKPRDDYMELVIHHAVTAWLVGWSYFTNLTQIGICIFVSMDLPDVVFAVSKCISYVGLEKTSQVSFVIFMSTWGYFRHWQNLRILHSVLTEFHLVPPHARTYSPPYYYLPPWMQWQIFLPILALQLLMFFWSYLILRVLWRMLSGKGASDVREEGEDGESEVGEGGEGEGGGQVGGLSPALPIRDLRTRSRSGTMDSIKEGEGEMVSIGSAREVEGAKAEGVRTRSRTRRE